MAGKRHLRDSQRSQKFLQKYLTRMGGDTAIW